MMRLTTISLLVLGFLGCEPPQKVNRTSSDREGDARAVFQRFENALKVKNTDEMADCLTDKAINGFYVFWRDLAEAEGLQFDSAQGFYDLTKDSAEGFYDLTKDSAVEAGVGADDTLRIVLPVKLKHSTKIVITLVGAGKGCRMDKFEAVK